MGNFQSIVVVCSGNTCRSPLAAAMLGRAVAQLPMLAGTSVSSAGTAAWDGAPASEGAYLVALEDDLDLGDHRARMLTTHIVDSADLILTVSEAHSHRVEGLGGSGKVFTLANFATAGIDEFDIVDPYGGDVSDYREVASQLSELVEQVCQRLTDRALQ